MPAEKKPRGTDDVHWNEPAPRIPHGARRRSTRVSRRGLPALARRERLNELLLAHDPEDAERVLSELTEDDYDLLRQMAREGALTGVNPRLRQNAIAALSRSPSIENLNLLTELARYGEDPYVRGHALFALGQTGAALATPVLVDALAAKDLFEAAAAERGLEALGRRSGADLLRASIASERRKTVLARLGSVIGRIEGKQSTRPGRAPKTTSRSRRHG